MVVTKRPLGFGEGRSRAYFRFIWLKPATYRSYDLLALFHCSDAELLELIDQVAEDRVKNKKLPVITLRWFDGESFKDYEVTIVRP